MNFESELEMFLSVYKTDKFDDWASGRIEDWEAAARQGDVSAAKMVAMDVHQCLYGLYKGNVETFGVSPNMPADMIPAFQLAASNGCTEASEMLALYEKHVGEIPGGYTPATPAPAASPQPAATTPTPSSQPAQENDEAPADFDKVTELDLSWQKITSLDIDFLRELKQLTILDLSSNQIGDVAPLKELTQLKELYLEGNPIGDLTPLKELTQLTALGLRGVANCSDMDALMNVLRALPELKWLDIGNNAMINDISPLAELTQLTELRAADNEISDITALQELTQLKDLYLSYNDFSNLTPLAGLKQLSSLSISSNPIEDLSPLKELTNLKDIELSEIEGLDAQIEELQKALPDCKIL